MSLTLRSLVTVMALTSLLFTVPAALWFTVILLAALLPKTGIYPPPWIDYLGWPVMIGVLLATGWVIYRVWRPYLTDTTEPTQKDS